MSQQDLITVFAGAGLLLALLGWVYQLGFSAARILRNEKDIEELRNKVEDREVKFREEVRDNFKGLYRKIDELPCKNLGWKRDDC